MKLKDLLRDVDVIELQGSAEVEIDRITVDSRQGGANTLFVAVPGSARDGADFIDVAIDKGARAVISQREMKSPRVTHVQVSDARRALAVIAANFWGRPADRLSLIGVTGTSGKTTTTKMLESILEATDEPVGLIGTIAYRAGQIREVADRTTPDASVLQAWFAKMVEQNVTRAVMEVSSHALAQGRVWGVPFAAAVFTNLSRDHLDYHRDMDEYFAAKKILFDQIDRSRRSAVVNIDDAWGRKLADELGSSTTITFGRSDQADVRPAADFRVDVDGLHGTVHTPAGDLQISSPLMGHPNLSNWLGAIGAAVAVDIPLETIELGVSALHVVAGRFERVAVEGSEATVIVDYAHKPDALEKLLATAREIAGDRRIVLVFGCGGDRDEGKRPLMGEIAGRDADYTIVTSDNPRSEDPNRIIDQVAEGLRGVQGAQWEAITDRRAAIERAVEFADEALVLVAGKGHENYQVIGDQIIHFDDREEVAQALRDARRRRSGS